MCVYMYCAQAVHKLMQAEKRESSNLLLFTLYHNDSNTNCLSCRGEEGEVTSKKEFIQTARMIAKESEEVVKMARKVAKACTDKRMATVSSTVVPVVIK